MSAFRTGCHSLQDGDRSASQVSTLDPDWKIWPTGIHFFRGYNPCSMPCSIMIRVQKSCTRFRKALSQFRPTYPLPNISSLPRVLPLEARPLIRDRRPRTPYSSTLMRSQSTVRTFSPILHSSMFDYRFAVIPQRPLCGRLVTCPTRDHRVIGFPVELHGNYSRNYLRYNVCFVFNRSADLSCYEPVVRKVSRVLTSCEVCLNTMSCFMLLRISSR